MTKKSKKIISIVLFAFACGCFLLCAVWNILMLLEYFERQNTAAGVDRLSLQYDMSVQTVFSIAGCVFAVISFCMKTEKWVRTADLIAVGGLFLMLAIPLIARS